MKLDKEHLRLLNLLYRSAKTMKNQIDQTYSDAFTEDESFDFEIEPSCEKIGFHNQESLEYISEHLYKVQMELSRLITYNSEQNETNN